MAAKDPSHNDIKQDVLTNPRYDAFFSLYPPKVRKDFASTYSSLKFQWQFRGANADAEEEAASGHFQEEAYNRLWDIQRKKLFDLQCRWRAGHVEAQPGLECSYDFETQDAVIENCLLVDPITAEELEMYCDFVRITDFDEVLDRFAGNWLDGREWHDYELMKLAEQEFEQDTPDGERQGFPAPAWYDFHNMRTGNGLLLGLPDVRAPHELHYRQAEAAGRMAKTQAYPAPPPPADPGPPSLHHVDREELLLDFVNEFEATKLRRHKAAYEALELRNQANEQLEEDFAYLKACGPDETVAIGPASDWRTALRQAVVESQRSQLLAHLPRVYDDYLMRRQMGISHPRAQEPHYRQGENNQWGRASLLDGRVALGEPRNFDFYD